MLLDIDYDDMGVIDLLTQGVRVVGCLPRTGIWQPSDKAPTCSLKTVWANAAEAQRKMLEPRPADSFSEEVWTITQEELSKGLLAGPYSREELAKILGPSWVGARRFGIKQGDKVRVIDDFSEFLVNSAFGSEEKVSIPSLDDVVRIARTMHESTASGQFRVRDTNGRSSSAEINSEWNNRFACLAGRVADLKS
eukprot:6505807-Karenia_brevis.AAC.1